MPVDDVQGGPRGGAWRAAWAGGVPEEGAERPGRLRLAGLALLVGLADLLFYGRAPGLSVAAFALALVLAMRVACGPREPVRGDAGTLVLLALAVLPVVEQVQGLSLLVLAVGLLALAARIAPGPGAGAEAVSRGMARFAGRYPGLAARGLGDGLRGLARTRLGEVRLARLARAWLLPGVAGPVLVGLLVAANPVLSLWAGELRRLPLQPWAAARHGAFWVVAAVLLWPFLAPGPHRDRPGTGARAWPVAGRPGWVNKESVRNSLVLFNLLLGVQTGLDLGYLWGGIELPEGVTYAQYAHRGAYPLVATALLAGGFALVSRPFAEGRPGLRALLGLWIAQNLLLAVSSLLRLDLYVDAFGLTRLRLAAGVWMGLVAGGLGLTAWQVWRGRTNGWLLWRVATMAGAVLYLCCFVNGAGVIARVNLDRFERTGALDRAYLCDLGPGAGPAIRAFATRTGADPCGSGAREGLAAPAPGDWREWGFRNWRLRRYGDAARAAEGESA